MNIKCPLLNATIMLHRLTRNNHYELFEDNTQQVEGEIMKRYFDVINKRITVAIDVTKEGEKLTVKQISGYVKTNLKEVTKEEYLKLNKEYKI